MCPEKGAERLCNDEEKKQYPPKKEAAHAHRQAGVKDPVLHTVGPAPGDSPEKNHKEEKLQTTGCYVGKSR